LKKQTNNELPLLLDWLQANRLSLNIKKTQVMIFGKKTKFVGVIVDQELNWKKHIIYTSKKIAKAIGILTKTKQILNRNTLIQLYYSFVYPYLIYGNLIWVMPLPVPYGRFINYKS
jgi:hypothetical protein